MSIEYKNQGDTLLKAGVQYFNAPGLHQAFSEMGNLSNGATVPANAKIVHIAGQLGRTEEDTIPDDILEEYRLAFANTEKALKAAGVKQGFAAVYKLHSFHGGDISEAQMNAYGTCVKEFCGNNRPTAVAVSVPKILWPGAHIEMFVEAVLTE